jgi:hypothetical protein
LFFLLSLLSLLSPLSPLFHVFLPLHVLLLLLPDYGYGWGLLETAEE